MKCYFCKKQTTKLKSVEKTLPYAEKTKRVCLACTKVKCARCGISRGIDSGIKVITTSGENYMHRKCHDAEREEKLNGPCVCDKPDNCNHCGKCYDCNECECHYDYCDYCDELLEGRKLHDCAGLYSHQDCYRKNIAWKYMGANNWCSWDKFMKIIKAGNVDCCLCNKKSSLKWTKISSTTSIHRDCLESHLGKIAKSQDNKCRCGNKIKFGSYCSICLLHLITTTTG